MHAKEESSTFINVMKLKKNIFHKRVILFSSDANNNTIILYFLLIHLLILKATEVYTIDYQLITTVVKKIRHNTLLYTIQRTEYNIHFK